MQKLLDYLSCIYVKLCNKEVNWFTTTVLLTLLKRPATIVNHWLSAAGVYSHPDTLSAAGDRCCLYMLMQGRDIVTMKTNRKSTLERSF